MARRSRWPARWTSAMLGLFSLLPPSASGIELNPSSPYSIKAAAKIIATDMLTFYTGDQPGGTPGLLPPPPQYYWWECGAMFGSLIDYWYYTGDTEFNNITTTGMLYQVGQYDNYEPQNQTFDLGNDDQAFWGMAAMSAAELLYPNPPADQPQWLALAQAVFNRQVGRWDPVCNGGLRWQVFNFNTGYNYKNAIANGCLFNLAARLGMYTGNQTYNHWAEKIWDWTTAVKIITEDYKIYDGALTDDNCTSFVYYQWSYNVGVFLLGAATLWNQTQDPIWYERTESLLNATHLFFQDNIMFEIECEPTGVCNSDQKSYKAYLSRWMAATTRVAPWTYDKVYPLLQSSAVAAAKACSGGSTGTFCGLKWTTGTWDGTEGVGQQMDALEVIQSLLITDVRGPVTSKTGGTSKGNAGAGGEDPKLFPVLFNINDGDRAGAGILTALMGMVTLGGAAWAII